jgi:phosphoribosylformylglycinamidine synthase subunit PurL
VPVAATNCLNFGNPEKPEIMAQLSAAIDGIAEASTALGTPITGGNVSLYNETKGEGIYPTPVIGVVGILEDVSKAVPADFQRAGDAVLLISGKSFSRIGDAFGASSYAKSLLQKLWGTPPQIDLADEASLQKFLTLLANKGLLSSARDISDGGLAVALAEATFTKRVGATIHLNIEGTALSLFGEEAGDIVATCDPANLLKVQYLATEFAFATVVPIGTTGGEHLKVISQSNQVVISERVDALQNAWSNALQSTLSVDTVTA